MNKNFQFSRLVLGIACSVLVSFVVTSCSSSEETIVVNNEYDKLLSELNEYSTNFESSHEVLDAKSRAGFSRFWKSVIADYGGFTSSGKTIISVGTSRAYWKKEKEREDKLKEQDNQNISQDTQNPQSNSTRLDGFEIASRLILKMQIDSLANAYASNNVNIGAMHNASILKSLLDDDMSGSTYEEIAASTINSLNELGYDTSDVSVDNVASEIEYFFDNFYSNDATTMFSKLTNKFPERSMEFRILNNYLSTSQSLGNTNDLKKFTDGYTTIINQSNLPTVEKNLLNSNISIAPSSFQLWNQIDKLLP